VDGCPSGPLRLSRATRPVVDPQLATAQVDADFDRLAGFIAEQCPSDTFPDHLEVVKERWSAKIGTAFPVDPFDGLDYGFDRLEQGYRLWSSGPDGEPGTSDDIRSRRP
jgi:hypothetical protein